MAKQVLFLGHRSTPSIQPVAAFVDGLVEKGVLADVKLRDIWNTRDIDKVFVDDSRTRGFLSSIRLPFSYTVLRATLAKEDGLQDVANRLSSGYGLTYSTVYG